MSEPSPRQEAMNDLRAAQSLIERAMTAIQSMPAQRTRETPVRRSMPPVLGSNAQPEKSDGEEAA